MLIILFCYVLYTIELSFWWSLLDDEECTRLSPCSHYCHNSPGSFACSCPTGLVLDTDGRTCKGFYFVEAWYLINCIPFLFIRFCKFVIFCSALYLSSSVWKCWWNLFKLCVYEYLPYILLYFCACPQDIRIGNVRE